MVNAVGDMTAGGRARSIVAFSLPISNRTRLLTAFGKSRVGEPTDFETEPVDEARTGGYDRGIGGLVGPLAEFRPIRFKGSASGGTAITDLNKRATCAWRLCANPCCRQAGA